MQQNDNVGIKVETQKFGKMESMAATPLSGERVMEKYQNFINRNWLMYNFKNMELHSISDRE